MAQPPADPEMNPLTLPEAGRLLVRPPPGAATHWLARRRRQASPAWYHQRTRLAPIAQVSQRMETAKPNGGTMCGAAAQCHLCATPSAAAGWSCRDCNQTSGF